MSLTLKKEKISPMRKLLIASVSATRQKNTIHTFIEPDISLPKELLNQLKREGQKVSITIYLVKCLATTLKRYPEFNAFISRGRIVFLKDIMVNVLAESNLGKDLMPTPIVLKEADKRSIDVLYKDLCDQRDQLHAGNPTKLPKASWLMRVLPVSLLIFLIKKADKSIAVAHKYGKIAVTSVGMFVSDKMHLIPHGSASVLLSVGGIYKDITLHDGQVKTIDRICLTLSFDHDLIDGGPASRFTQDLKKEIESGSCLQGLRKGTKNNGARKVTDSTC